MHICVYVSINVWVYQFMFVCVHNMYACLYIICMYMPCDGLGVDRDIINMPHVLFHGETVAVRLFIEVIGVQDEVSSV